MGEYDLERFVKAQADTYQTALNEIKSGRKRSHWMWYIFPQIQGLGFSGMSQRYAILDLNEAACYLEHEVLGSRLIEISNALLAQNTDSATTIFGKPDDMKLRSSMTLFAQVDNAPPIFQKILDKFFGGTPDEKTLRILGLKT